MCFTAAKWNYFYGNRELTMTNSPNEPESTSSLNGQSILVLFIAAGLGTLAATFILPAWLPGLAGSLAVLDPKVFWYLSRATAFVALGILWASMMLGIGISNKMARLWPEHQPPLPCMNTCPCWDWLLPDSTPYPAGRSLQQLHTGAVADALCSRRVPTVLGWVGTVRILQHGAGDRQLLCP